MTNNTLSPKPSSLRGPSSCSTLGRALQSESVLSGPPSPPRPRSRSRPDIEPPSLSAEKTQRHQEKDDYLTAPSRIYSKAPDIELIFTLSLSDTKFSSSNFIHFYLFLHNIKHLPFILQHLNRWNPTHLYHWTDLRCLHGCVCSPGSTHTHTHT